MYIYVHIYVYISVCVCAVCVSIYIVCVWQAVADDLGTGRTLIAVRNLYTHTYIYI